MKRHENNPYTTLGEALRKLREKHAKTPLEVSGAIEVNVNQLSDYESGKARPSEDILALIIQHYDLKDEEADKLRKLAGYDINNDGYYATDDESNIINARQVYISQQDMRIVYTDMVQISVNNYGVVINFLQGAGINNTPLAVSRIGMSKEHAKSLLDVLSNTLKQADVIDKKSSDTKKLPPSTSKK